MASAGELVGPQALLKTLSKAAAPSPYENIGAVADLSVDETVPDLVEIEKSASDSIVDEAFGAESDPILSGEHNMNS